MLLLVVVCIVLFAMPVFGAENVDKGFRGIPWGATLPKDGNNGNNKWGLYEVEDHFSDKVYERDNENLSFGGAQVLYIEYSFQESLGFANVELFFHGLDNYKLIRKACVEKWGQPVWERIDSALQGPEELKAKNKNSEVFDHNQISTRWERKGVSIRLEHSNKGKSAGSLEINLDNYYKMCKIDNAKYPEYHEIQDELRKVQEAMFPE